MYCQVQADIISHYDLKEHLRPCGYSPEKITQCLWNHKDRDIHFVLVVDDFGINYTKKNDAYHLITTLKYKYEVT